MTAFKYNYAVVSRIPDSFMGHRGQDKVPNLEALRAEHTQFVEILRELGIDVLELDAEERYAECVSVDDCAVVINGTALMCNPLGNHRQGEVNLIRQTLKRELGLKISELSEANATVEGGDVLFTGKEIFVGISRRTNELGAQCVARAFPEYPTTIVKVPSNYKLKQLIAMGGASILAVGSSDTSRKCLKDMMNVASYGYKVISLAEDIAANVLFLNGSLIHLSPGQIPKSYGTFENKIDYNRVSIDMPLMVRAELPLASLSLLVGKFKFQKRIISTLP